MVIETDKLKEKCSIILAAVDSNELSVLTETLELKTKDDALYMSVTNKEYYAQVKLGLSIAEQLHATVNANMFLKLISQITTASIELNIESNALRIKGNGVYKLPLIFDNEKLLELPKIEIYNRTANFNIDSDILNSILQFNSKELLKGVISRPVQKLYYIDEQGALTFTSGACVNSFLLTQPIKLLLNDRLVKLFKLFKNTQVNFSLGYDSLSDTIIQTKVRFETDNVVLTAIISCDDTLLNSVPVNAIRGRANSNYPYSINLDRDALLQTINRLLIFDSGKTTTKPFGKFDFEENAVKVWDISGENSEYVNYNNTSLMLSDKCSIMLNLIDLKATLETCSEKYLTLNFGDSQAIVIVRGNIKNIIPEVKVVN